MQQKKTPGKSPIGAGGMAFSPIGVFTLKQYFLGSQKSADYPPHIFQAFYLAQPKGLCGNYRHFPAKRF